YRARPQGGVPPGRRRLGRSVASPLEVRHLTKRFGIGGALRRSQVHAVEDVSFALRPGTITALVGESGSGKTTVARLLARLYDPTSGAVLFDGDDVSRVRRRRDVLRYRSQVQIIFQDPFGSLNPVKTIRHHVERPLRIHRIVPPDRGEARAYEQVLAEPLHPYTRLLLAAVPDPAKRHAERIEARKGLASAAVDPPEGCRFVSRCPLAIDVCSRVTPPLVEARPGQAARCHVTAP